MPHAPSIECLWCCHCCKNTLFTHLFTQQQQQPFNGRLSGTTRVGRYQKKHSPAHTHPGQRTSFITFICNGPRHPLYSAYVLDSPLEQPLSRSSLVFLLVLNPQLHTPCISSPNHHHFFRSTCPYQRSLFCCNTNVMSSIPSLSLSSLSVSVEYYTCLTASFPGQPG